MDISPISARSNLQCSGTNLIEDYNLPSLFRHRLPFPCPFLPLWNEQIAAELWSASFLIFVSILWYPRIRILRCASAFDLCLRLSEYTSQWSAIGDNVYCKINTLALMWFSIFRYLRHSTMSTLWHLCDLRHSQCILFAHPDTGHPSNLRIVCYSSSWFCAIGSLLCNFV